MQGGHRPLSCPGRTAPGFSFKHSLGLWGGVSGCSGKLAAPPPPPLTPATAEASRGPLWAAGRSCRTLLSPPRWRREGAVL